MEFFLSDPQTEFEKLIGGHFYINAVGTIEPGDDEKFRDFLLRSTPPPRAAVYIDSSGGDVESAIGRLIRDHWFSCTVGKYVLDIDSPQSPIASRKLISGQCMSAATLIYIGGRLRYFPEGSAFGVHQFSFRNPSPEHIGRSQELSAKIAAYVADMGISSKFLEISSSTASTQINRLSGAQLQELGVVTGGQTEAEWSIQARNQVMYVRGERDSLYGHHKVMLCNAKGVGFLFWAVIEAQGREHELTTFGLVEVVVNGEEVRIDISQRCVRTVNGIYVNVLARISEEEAKTIAFSESFGVQIRFTSEAPIFLGIAAMSTEGGREQLQTFFNTLCSEKHAE